MHRFTRIIGSVVLAFFLTGCATYTEIEITDKAPSQGGVNGKQGAVVPGKTVRVTSNEGKRIEGKVVELTATDLVIITSPNYGEEEVSFAWEAISKIEEIKDPSNQGLLVIGTIVAVIVFSTVVGWITWPPGFN